MRCLIPALLLLAACAPRPPTELERMSRAIDKCETRFKGDNHAAAACIQSLEDGARELRQIEHDMAQQQAVDDLNNQLQRQRQDIEALQARQLRWWERP